MSKKYIKHLEEFRDAIDEQAVITWTLNKNYTPKQQLEAIIDWHIVAALDSRVNGGYELMKCPE